MLHHLKTFPNLLEINLRDLSYKLVILCALVTGERCQSLHLNHFDTMVKSPSSYWFVIKTTEEYNNKLTYVYPRKPAMKIFLTRRSNDKTF